MDEVSRLLNLDGGAQFRSVDLHVHTPASRDMGAKWAAAEPRDLVDLALEKHLDAIAITDHNSVAWCDTVRAAARDTKLAVFPGVEISTSEGHVLAIFDRDKPANEIEEFLVMMGIGSKQRGDLHAIASNSLTEVAALAEDDGGVAIAAHVDRPKGFWIQMERSPARRIEIYRAQAIRALEIVDTTLRPDFLNGTKSGYTRKVACLQGSDSYVPKAVTHDLDAMGSRRSYLSVGEMSIAGLRNALLDPEIRVRLDEDDIPRPRAVIEGMWVSGGFFDTQMIRLNPNITCLIGGTGSGKSLSLELLRYALAQQVDLSVLERIAEDVERLLGFALGDLAAVSVVVAKDGHRYLVQRSWASSPPDPTVQRITDDGPVPLSDPVDVATFFPIRAFSQGEIIEYAREPLARLSLLDDLIDIDEDLRTVGTSKTELRRNAANLVEAEAKLRSAEDEVRELAGVAEDVDRYSKLLKHSKVKEQDAWYAEQRALNSALETLGGFRADVADAFPEFEGPLVDVDHLGDATPSLDLMKAVATAGETLRQVVGSSLSAMESAVAAAEDRTREVQSTWAERFDAANAAYQKVVAALDPAVRSQAGLHTTLSSLRAKHEHLSSVQEAIGTKLRPRLETLDAEREGLLDKLQAARRAIRSKREAKARDLSERLERRVLIKIAGASHIRPFLAEVLDLRTGSSVRESDLRAVTEKLHPVRFVKLLVSGGFEELAGACNVPAEVLKRLAENIRERGRLDDLYEAQLTDVEDEVRVQFAVESQEYRDLAALAHGQKCTVVLMIALAEGDFPLLVDQPEDALHAPWIEQYIVSSLRRRRGERQCIFATRSANVLVSADAEQIVALRADAIHGVVDQTGSLDGFGTRELVLYHVEGGEAAFERRQAKYEASRHG